MVFASKKVESNHTMPSKILQIIKFLIGWPLTIVALFFLGKIIISNLYTINYAIANINAIFLLFGVTSFLGYFFLRAFFWQRLLSIQEHKLSFKETAFLWGFTELK